MSRVALVLLALACGSGCAATPRPPSGILVLRVAPPDARVLLDDRYIGSAAQLSGRPLKLDSGLRRLEVSAEGRYSARREAAIQPAGRTELTIDLRAIPEGERDLH